MIGVAKRKELFPLTDFQSEGEAPGRRPMQLLHHDDDGQFALYMSTSISDQKPPPHNHATWAVIVGIQGEERNWLFERTDDGSVPGQGTVRVVDEQVAAPGTGVALMPEDIHSIQGKRKQGVASPFISTASPPTGSRGESLITKPRGPTGCFRQVVKTNLDPSALASSSPKRPGRRC